MAQRSRPGGESLWFWLLATPAIIGGRRVKVVTTAIYDEFLSSLNWPLGAAIAMLLLPGIVFVVIGSNRFVERRFKQVFA